MQSYFKIFLILSACVFFALFLAIPFLHNHGLEEPDDCPAFILQSLFSAGMTTLIILILFIPLSYTSCGPSRTILPALALFSAFINKAPPLLNSN